MKKCKFKQPSGTKCGLPCRAKYCTRHSVVMGDRATARSHKRTGIKQNGKKQSFCKWMLSYLRQSHSFTPSPAPDDEIRLPDGGKVTRITTS